MSDKEFKRCVRVENFLLATRLATMKKKNVEEIRRRENRVAAIAAAHSRPLLHHIVSHQFRICAVCAVCARHVTAFEQNFLCRRLGCSQSHNTLSHLHSANDILYIFLNLLFPHLFSCVDVSGAFRLYEPNQRAKIRAKYERKGSSDKKKKSHTKTGTPWTHVHSSLCSALPHYISIYRLSHN